MKTQHRHLTLKTVGTAITLLTSIGAFAANECRIEYGFNTGSGFNRVDHKKFLNLNVNQTKTINQSNMNYIKNLKSNKVKAKFDGASDVTLDEDAANPLIGFYLTPVKLKTVKCLNATSVAFGSPEAMLAAMKQANNTALQIAQGLHDVFNLGAQQIGQLLKAANYTAEQIAGALQDVFNASTQQVAQWLKNIGYTGAQVAAALKAGINATATNVANALKDVFSASASQVGQWLKAADYAANQIAAALKSAFNASNQQVTQWLKDIGYTGAQIAAALKTGLNESAKNAAKFLDNVFSASTSQVAQWLKAGGYTLIQVAQGIEDIETDPEKIVQALKSAFNASADQMVQTLKQMQIILTTQTCGAAGCNTGAQVLKNVGYQLNETLKALKTHFNLSVQAAHSIAKNVFGATDAAIQQALAFAGYTAQQISSVMTTAITLAAKPVQQITQAGVQAAQRTGTIVAQQSALALYDAYFQIVGAGAKLVPLHSTLRNALNAAQINVNSVRIGYSSYQSSSNAAITDCDKIYFPDALLVSRLNRGATIDSAELHWLLHELGHTMQCRSSSRTAFANRWFNELSPAVILTIQRGNPDSNAIHDAMPLERAADTFADRNMAALRKALNMK